MSPSLATTDVRPEHAFLITQTLAREAILLDTSRFTDWLGLLDADIRYRVPIPEWVKIDDDNDARDAAAGPLEFTYLDEGYASLKLRVDRLLTGLAHGEFPPSLSARIV